MKYLLVVAHGSRRAASNDEVRDLTAAMAKQMHDFDAVGCAFLELAEPLIPEGIRQAVSQGADEIVVMPYFLSAGRHVVTDVPEEIDSVRDEFADIKITVAPYLGSAEAIQSVVLDQARKAS